MRKNQTCNEHLAPLLKKSGNFLVLKLLLIEALQDFYATFDWQCLFSCKTNFQVFFFMSHDGYRMNVTEKVITHA